MKTPASMYTKPASFADVAIGENFARGGTVFVKWSTRTARVFWPSAPERSIYFRQWWEVTRR